MNTLYVTIFISWCAIFNTVAAAPTTASSGHQNVVRRAVPSTETYEDITKPRNSDRSDSSDGGVYNAKFFVAIIDLEPADDNAKHGADLSGSMPSEHQYERPRENEVSSKRNKRAIDYYDDDSDDFQTADTRSFMPYVRYRRISGQRFYINRRNDRPYYPAMVGYDDGTGRFPTVA